MSFNPFNGRMPFFGGRPSFSGMDLSDIAEDVPFEEVKSEPAKPQIDKDARDAQISAEAMSRFESLLEKNPISTLLVSVIFSLGAKWADKHPVSEFGSVEAWMAAQRKKVGNMIAEMPAAKADAFFVMLHHAIFSAGAQWAIETPAPTL